LVWALGGILTGINCIGIQVVAFVQNLLTVIKVTALAVIVVILFSWGSGNAPQAAEAHA
jgi:amino acid transporter